MQNLRVCSLNRNHIYKSHANSVYLSDPNEIIVDIEITSYRIIQKSRIWKGILKDFRNKNEAD